MRLKKFLLLIICLVTAGCGATGKNAYTGKPFKPQEKGFFHTVKKGQTLWGISQLYCVGLNDLASYNRIDNAKTIEIGQKIFIPDALTQKNKICEGELETLFIWPHKGSIQSGFNEIKQNVKNQGIDITARQGDSVCAAADGNIIFTSENFRGYGRTIIIEHSRDFLTVYANNNDILVKTGDYVRQGQVIATAGSSGRAQTCMLHFELRKNHKPQNPVLYLP